MRLNALSANRALLIAKLRLPLSMEKPDAFACIPEYALQNIVDNFKFVFR